MNQITESGTDQTDMRYHERTTPPDNSHPGVIPPTLFHLPLRNLPTIHVEFMWVGIFRGGGNCPSGNNYPGAFSEP